MSRQFLAIPLVAAMCGYGALIFWVATKGTALSWILLVVVSIGLAVLIGVAFARRSRTGTGPFPQAAAPEDGFYRVLVVADGEAQPSVLQGPLRDAASGHPIKAFAVAPVFSSSVDRVTGDQAAYERANGALASTLAALEAIGAEASGRLGSHDAVQAVADALQEFPAQAIVLTSRLDGRVVEQIKRRAVVTVTQVDVAE